MKIRKELRDWVVAMSREGHDIQAIAAMMEQAGYGGRQSRQILAHVLDRPALALEVEMPPTAGTAQAVRSEGALRSTPPEAPGITIDGRHVKVSTSATAPILRVLHGLLDDAECDALIELARPRLERARTVDVSGKQQIDAARTSSAMFFAIAETALIRTIEQRVATLVGMPVEHGEALQVLNYQPGQQYEPHQDWFDPRLPGYKEVAQAGGQRVATVLIYLNTPEKGGGTHFPHLGLTVAAHRGDVVYFAYEGGEAASLHAGLPVERGEKWIATRWLREQPYYKA